MDGSFPIQHLLCFYANTYKLYPLLKCILDYKIEELSIFIY